MDRLLILVKPVSVAIAVLGIVEGLSWTIFSLVCILGHFDVISKNVSSLDHYVDYAYVLFIIDQNYTTLRTINSNDFLIFLFAYFFSSLVWTFLSVYMLWAFLHNKWKRSTVYVYDSCAALIMATSILDLVLFGFLLSDRKKISDFNEKQPIVHISEIASAYFTTASIIIRGYVLWLFNVIAAGVLIRFAVNLDHKLNNPDDGSMASVYDTKRPPTSWIDGAGNAGYADDLVTASFEALDYDRQRPPSGRNYYLNSTYDLPYYSEPPYIPTPDYTPPGTPNLSLRPALKRRSKFS